MPFIQGRDNYKFGNKNNHRRWKWNRIVEKLRSLKKTVSEAVVIYLPGPDDLDREIALSKGFKNHNLIAIDLNIKNINKIKINRNNCIQADFLDIMAHWNGNPELDVIDGDFCGGLTESLVDMAILLLEMQGRSRWTVLSINMMRGRDKTAKKFRNGLIQVGAPDTKHRGELFYDFYNYIETKNWLIADKLSETDSKKISREDFLKMTEEIGGSELTDYRNKLFDIHNPLFNSYKSESGLVMDSCIFTLLPIAFDRSPDNNYGVKRNKLYSPNKLKHQIAALKAWRTMRAT